MPKRFAFVLLPVLAILAAAGGYWYSQRAPATPVINRQAPAFQLRTLAGQTAALSDYRGRPVVVNFWATWCAPCKKEMPALQAEAASHPGLTILGVDNVEAAVKVKPFVKQHGLTYPILLDQDGSV
ncbi:MAG: TlpA family protein disulfide reductase, partial [Chloroflexota bacterium]